MPIHRVSENQTFDISCDSLAVEEPLEIRLSFLENGETVHKSISITMRTPGDDFDLAAGALQISRHHRGEYAAADGVITRALDMFKVRNMTRKRLASTKSVLAFETRP